MDLSSNIPTDLMPVQAAQNLPADLQPVSQNVNFPTAAGGTASLTPEQARRYYQEVQATPLNANPLANETGMRTLARSLAAPVSGAVGIGANLLAGKVGDISPDAGTSIEKFAEDFQDFGNGAIPGLINTGTGLATGAATVALPGGPLLAGINTAGNGLFSEIRAERAGKQFDPGAVIKAIAEGGVDYAFNLLLQKGLSGGVAKSIVTKLAPTIGELPAAIAGRSVVGGGLNMANNTASNFVNGRPLEQGALSSFVQGAAMENLAAGLHGDIAGKSIFEQARANQAAKNAPPEQLNQQKALPAPPEVKGLLPSPETATVGEIPLKPETPTTTLPETNANVGAKVPLDFQYDLKPNEESAQPAQPTPAAPPTEDLKPIGVKGKEIPPSADQIQVQPEGVKQAETPAQSPVQTPESDRTVSTAEDIKHAEALKAFLDELGTQGSIEPGAGISDVPTSRKIRAGMAAEVPATEKPISSDAVVNRIRQMNTGEMDPEAAKQLLGDKSYVKRNIPIDEVGQVLGEDRIDQKRVQDYADQPAESRPPITVNGDGTVVDGKHRLAAAKANGEDTVSAYVPSDSKWAEAPAAKEQVKPLKAEMEFSTPQAAREIAQHRAENLGKAHYIYPTEEGKVAVDQRQPTDRPAMKVNPDGSIEGVQAAKALPDRIERRTSTAAETPPSTETLSAKPSLLSDESGGTQAFQKFAERTAIPATRGFFRNLKASVKNLSDFFGMGTMDTGEQTTAKNEVRSMTGNMEQRKAVLNDQLMPARNAAEELPQGQRDSLVDALASGKNLPAGPLSQASAAIHKANQDLAARAKAVGINTNKWTEDHVGRLFVDANGQLPGRKGSIAGPEGYLKGPQEYDTYAEAKAAAAKRGLKPMYDNPVEMAYAKLAEAEHSISARELVDKKIQDGSIQELSRDKSLPDGMAYLNDRLARQGPNRLIAPEAVANTFNQIIDTGLKPGLPVIDNIIQMKRATASLNFALSAWHIPTITTRMFGSQFVLGLKNIAHGDLDLAAKNFGRALPGGQTQFGSAIRKAALAAGEEGPLQPLIKAANDAGVAFNERSMLAPTAWEKAQRAYKEGDIISAGGRAIQAVGDLVSRPIMERFVPNVKATYMAAQAETAIREGLTGEKLAERMRLAAQNGDNVLGQVVRSNQFQHKVVQDLMDTLFSAPKFAEGDIRLGGAAIRDTLKGIAQIATGKGGTRVPEFTPAMQSAVGHVITQATFGAATQMALSYGLTGKMQYPTQLKDFFMPRTGNKNADGSDERLMLPTGLSLFTSLATEGASKTVANRVSPLWRAVADVYNNADYRNTQVRDPNASFLTQAEQAAKHIGKAFLPFSVQNMVEQPTGNESSPVVKAAGFLGMRKASPKESQSDATRLAHEFAYGNVPTTAKTPEEADKYDTKRKIENAVRNNQPNTQELIRTALTSGTLVKKDIDDAKTRAKQPQDLRGIMSHSSLTTKQAMQVWDAATPEEKKQIRLTIKGKIGRDEELKPEERQAFYQKLAPAQE